LLTDRVLARVVFLAAAFLATGFFRDSAFLPLDTGFFFADRFQVFAAEALRTGRFVAAAFFAVRRFLVFLFPVRLVAIGGKFTTGSCVLTSAPRVRG